MTDLSPVTAFGTTLPREASFGTLKMTEETGLALASLALTQGARVPSPLGLVLPGPGAMSQTEGCGAFWMAPGQWMVFAGGRAEEDFAALLSAASPDGSVTEQTDGWVVLDIVVTDIVRVLETLLERLVNLPLASLAPGCATRTVLHHMGVFLLRPRPEQLMILGMRSGAGSLWHAVEQAAGRLGK